jgi:glucose-1-phosphate thymidylyltransferase
VRVESGVTLENVQLGPNVTIGTGCTVRNATLRDTIIGENTTLENVRLHKSLIGDHVELRNIAGEVNAGDHTVISGTH